MVGTNFLLWTAVALGVGMSISLYGFAPDSGEATVLAPDPAEWTADLSKHDAAGAGAYEYMRTRHAQPTRAEVASQSQAQEWRLHGVGVEPAPYALVELGGELLTLKPGDVIQPGIVLERVDKDMIILKTPEGTRSVPLFQ